MKIRLEIQKRCAEGKQVSWKVNQVFYLIPNEVWRTFKEDFVNPDKVWEELMKTNRVVYHRKENKAYIFEVCNRRRMKSLKL